MPKISSAVPCALIFLACNGYVVFNYREMGNCSFTRIVAWVRSAIFCRKRMSGEIRRGTGTRVQDCAAWTVKCNRTTLSYSFQRETIDLTAPLYTLCKQTTGVLIYIGGPRSSTRVYPYKHSARSSTLCSYQCEVQRDFRSNRLMKLKTA